MRPFCVLLLMFVLPYVSRPCSAQALRDPLIGCVLDPDRKPVPGIRVEAFRAGGRGTGLLDLDYKNDFRLIATTKTGKDGRFAMHLPVGLPCRITVDHKPHALFLREDCLPGDDIRIELLKPATVTGRLTLADGTPAKAKLRAWHRDSHDTVLIGETDEDGRFHFDRVPPGPLRLDIDPERASSPRWLDTDLVAGQTFEHNLQLTAGVMLSGRVVDATTNKPIAGARIGEGWTLNHPVTTKADGTFEMHGYGSKGYRSVHCKASGYVKMISQVTSKNGPQQIEFLMKLGETTIGRIIDEHGKPIADTYVQAFGCTRSPVSRYHNCIATRTNADGKFRIAGLRPDITPVVVVRKDGFATRVYALPEAKNDVRTTGDIVLTRPRIVRGQVTGLDGKPLANTAVQIWGYNDDHLRLDPDGPLARNQLEARWLKSYVGHRKTRTDHLGRFAFGDVAAGDWQVKAITAQRQELGVVDPTIKRGVDPKPVKLSTNN